MLERGRNVIKFIIPNEELKPLAELEGRHRHEVFIIPNEELKHTSS